jgi:hypothetical protein
MKENVVGVWSPNYTKENRAIISTRIIKVYYFMPHRIVSMVIEHYIIPSNA